MPPIYISIESAHVGSSRIRTTVGRALRKLIQNTTTTSTKRPQGLHQSFDSRAQLGKESIKPGHFLFIEYLPGSCEYCIGEVGRQVDGHISGRYV